jgi:hypothetical protein
VFFCVPARREQELQLARFVDDFGFDPAYGARFEFGYGFLSVTYTLMNYKADFGPKIKANAIGFAFSFVF